MPTPRKSLAEHELHGTKPHYDVGVRQSLIEGGRPRAPKWLTPGARRKFLELAKELLKRRMATRGDADLLAMAATLFERWRIANDHLTKEGAVVTVQYFSKNGTPYTRERKNPHLEVAQATEKQFLAVLQQLGLTVVTRDRPRPTSANTGKEVIPGSALDVAPWLFDSSKVTPIRPEPVDPNEMVASEEQAGPKSEPTIEEKKQ